LASGQAGRGGRGLLRLADIATPGHLKESKKAEKMMGVLQARAFELFLVNRLCGAQPPERRLPRTPSMLRRAPQNAGPAALHPVPFFLAPDRSALNSEGCRWTPNSRGRRRRPGARQGIPHAALPRRQIATAQKTRAHRRARRAGAPRGCHRPRLARAPRRRRNCRRNRRHRLPPSQASPPSRGPAATHPWAAGPAQGGPDARLGCCPMRSAAAGGG
jgi:hypothetical protein